MTEAVAEVLQHPESERPRLFPTAAQPNLIRAQQKDELYQQHLVDACHDAVRWVLGPRRALRWAAETRLLAEMLYHALTTGSGLQSLGEEYCDILQVAGPGDRPPGPARRGLLVLLQAAGPYLAARLAAAVHSDGGDGDGGDPAGGGFAAWHAAVLAQQQHSQQQAREAGAGLGQPQQLNQPATLLQWCAAAAQRAQQAAQRAARPLAACLPPAGAFLRDHGATLLRIHLALFYLFGLYYQPAKRATGVRYLFLGRSSEGRPSYHVLGLLLILQLSISALSSLAQRYGAGPLTVLLGARQAAAAGARPRHALLLAEDGKQAAGSGGTPDDGSSASAWAAPEAPEAPAAAAADREVPGSRKCPLCLSARSHPTATPCGHVFCWQCIANWCAQKAECPLCRADFVPSSLLPLLHADY